jgi:hypothetical protein
VTTVIVNVPEAEPAVFGTGARSRFAERRSYTNQ